MNTIHEVDRNKIPIPHFGVVLENQMGTTFLVSYPEKCEFCYRSGIKIQEYRERTVVYDPFMNGFEFNRLNNMKNLFHHS